MWKVLPEYTGTRRDISVLHLDTFLQGAHLMPAFDKRPLPRDFHYTYTLDAFRAFYVNKYIDHHANEVAF